MARKCELLGVARSSMYYKSLPQESDSVQIMNEIQQIYGENPFYGYRRILIDLRKMGHRINHKRLQRLLCMANIKAVYPGKKTTVRNPEHKVYPYLLRNMQIIRPNQAWQVDITYIKIRHGFVYLICLVDVFSRRIMGWAISTFLDTASCLIALDYALKHATPEIINSDQGCQFTSVAWTEKLVQSGVKISMDGKGRWADNIYIERLWRTIKYESVFLHSFDTVEQAKNVLVAYIEFYNSRRPHQSLNYHTPNEIYRLGKIPTKQELFSSFIESLNNLKSPEVLIPKFL